MLVHTVHDTSSIMCWFWKYNFQNQHFKQQKTKKKTLSQLIIFQNILNAHYPQFRYYSETYKYRKIPHLTYTSVKWLFGLKSELRKSFLATYVQISSELY